MNPPDPTFQTVNAMLHGTAVSCQAADGSPMNSPAILSAFARCAELAGACAIRANHGPNIAAIRHAVKLPVIGLKKREIDGFEVYITPEWSDVLEVAMAGADIVALDATNRPRPGGHGFAELTDRLHSELGKLVMADVSTVDEGVAAEQAGADIVATTLSGYTKDTRYLLDNGPDLLLVQKLALSVQIPVACEGRIHLPDDVRRAREAGAWCVVVGTAITDPMWIARRFVQAR